MRNTLLLLTLSFFGAQWLLSEPTTTPRVLVQLVTRETLERLGLSPALSPTVGDHVNVFISEATPEAATARVCADFGLERRCQYAPIDRGRAFVTFASSTLPTAVKTEILIPLHQSDRFIVNQ
jgi:hypothetical protein